MTLVHVARGSPLDGVLYPNVVYGLDRHPLLRPARVSVEFCLGGVVRGDAFFDHLTAVTVIPYEALAAATDRLTNLWPTGTGILGPVVIPPGSLVVHEADAPAPTVQPGVTVETFESPDPSARRARVAELVQARGRPWWDIESLSPGFQRTTWRSLDSGVDHLDPQMIGGTVERLGCLRGPPGVCIGDSYRFAAGKLQSRLHEFFQCWQHLGFDVWWASFDMANGRNALRRFDNLASAARSDLRPALLRTTAWALIEEYIAAARFLMTEHLAAAEAEVSDYGYIVPVGVPSLSAADYRLFLAAAEVAPRTRRRLRAVAPAFRRVRSHFDAATPIRGDHPLVCWLRARVEAAGVPTDEPTVLRDMNGLWASLFDACNPGATAAMEQLTIQLVEEAPGVLADS